MKIEFLDDDDIEECNDFHNRAYDTNRSLKQWHWQFDGLIGGRRPFIVAKDGGRIVGTQALMPIKMINSKEVFLTAKSEETLVDSSMRGRGVFQKMYEPLMSFIHEQDVRSVWGFTPANKSFENIGFYVPGKTSQLVHPLSHRAFDVFQSQIQSGIKRPLFKVAIGMASILSATRLAMASRHNSEIEIKIIEEPIFDADIFCKKFVSDWGGVTIFRDQKYLQWRYFDNPKVKATLIGAYKNNQLMGWLAFSLDESSVGYIVDALVLKDVDSKKILQSLLLEATLALRDAGAIAIRGWHINKHPFDQFFIKVACELGFYFVKKGEPAVLLLTAQGRETSSLINWDEWYVTRAYTQGESG